MPTAPKLSKLLLLLFLLSCGFISAQDSINSAIVEQKTYQLYLDKNWNELIKYGNKAVKKGFDYFYMQMRIGIAYYEKKNYCLAENHFRKALKYSSTDELAQEYLYYCYLYNGRYEDARLLSKKFSKELAEKIGTNKQSSLAFLLVEGGTKITDSLNYYDANKKTRANYYDPAIYFQAGLNHYIKNRVSLFHAITYFDQQNFVSKVSQLQYYLKASVPIKNNWLISPAFHWVSIKNTSEIRPIPSGTMLPGPPPKTTTTVTNSNYFLGAITVQKNIRKFVFSIGTTVSNINNVTQYIHSGFVGYSVLGNSKLVLGCSGYLNTIDGYSTTNTSVAPFIYLQPINKVSIKMSYFLNTKTNIIEDNGYLVNNSADLTQSRWSVIGNFTINKQVSFYTLYQLEHKQELQQLFNYKYNIIVAGIKTSF